MNNRYMIKYIIFIGFNIRDHIFIDMSWFQCKIYGRKFIFIKEITKKARSSPYWVVVQTTVDDNLDRGTRCRER